MISFSKLADSSWNLNYPGLEGKGGISIFEEIKKSLKPQDILVVDFLYQNYIKQSRGVILNEEIEFNSHFQVSTFFNRIFCSLEQKFLALVLTSAEYIIKWHYHLSVHGGLRVQILGPKTCPADFDQEHGLVLLLAFQDIKLADALIDYSFFSVVIECFDEIASKPVVRKLQGEFNIGLSSRNFYNQPDHKLQWIMLNWSNPGLFGKLGDFCSDDSDNFSNLRDNYHPWWFILTWRYCENFCRPSEFETSHYTKTLSSWATSNGLHQNIMIKQGRTQKLIKVKKFTKKTYNKIEKSKQENECEIIPKLESNNGTEIEKSEDDIENDSVISELIQEDISGVIETHHCENSQIDLEEEPNEDDIILSIINEVNIPGAGKEIDHQSQLAYKKKELMSDIFDDVPSLKNEPNSDESDVILSLI